MNKSRITHMNWLVVVVLAGTLFAQGDGAKAAPTANVTLDAATKPRPFWTEKSSYLEDDILYVVGSASKVKTEEQGRKQAFENAKIELQNFAQVTDISGLEVRTQMTFTERNSDGTYNVFRLMKVLRDDLLKHRDAVMKRSEESARQIEASKEAELESKRKAIARLEEIQADSASLDERYSALLARIEERSSLAYTKVRRGMSAQDIIAFLGTPTSQDCEVSGNGALNYGKIWVVLEGGVAQCLVDSANFSHCGNCGVYRAVSTAIELR